jgi:hypothetical protein
MKKIVTLMMMCMMMFTFTLTADAAKSPSGSPVTDGGKDTATSPKTGESEILLYGCGMAAVVLASGAVVLRKKAI